MQGAEGLFVQFKISNKISFCQESVVTWPSPWNKARADEWRDGGAKGFIAASYIHEGIPGAIHLDPQ